MELLGKAAALACQLHAGQVRTGTSVPYVSHPLEVAALALRHGASEAEAAGAVLHDAVEDCGGSPVLALIERSLGGEVAAIVAGCSDSFAPRGAKKVPWKERKLAYLAHLAGASRSVILVTACDKLSNASAIARDHAVVGAALWERFSAGEAGQKWYYGALLEVFKGRARELPRGLLEELGAAVGRVLSC